jgi:hypothetical protein
MAIKTFPTMKPDTQGKAKNLPGKAEGPKEFAIKIFTFARRGNGGK